MRRLTLFFATILAASAAGASTVRLVAPADGATLRGGSFATIEWQAGGSLAGAEEWEAFLSFDGGKYYALRITPRLDLHKQTAQWFVPNVASRDARILIRYGDEVDEHIVELPIRFTIEAQREAKARHADRSTSAIGESARPNDRGIVGWVDGDRAGKVTWSIGVRPQAQRSMASRTRAITARDRMRVPVAQPEEEFDAVAKLDTIDASRTLSAQRAKDILLLTTRLNV